MKRIFSKINSKYQTVIPSVIREQLDLKSGDSLRYRVTEQGIVLQKAIKNRNNPFAVFSEWADEQDDEAYAEL